MFAGFFDLRGSPKYSLNSKNWISFKSCIKWFGFCIHEVAKAEMQVEVLALLSLFFGVFILKKTR